MESILWIVYRVIRTLLGLMQIFFLFVLKDANTDMESSFCGILLTLTFILSAIILIFG